MKEEDIKIAGDLIYYANNQESVVELNSLILILKTKIWKAKSQITKKEDIGEQNGIK